MLLYLLLGSFPKVKVLRKKLLKKADTEEDVFLFEINITSKDQINYFLERLSLETNFFNEVLLDKNLLNLSVQNGNTCSLNTKILLSQFFDLKELMHTHFNDLNLEKMVLHMNIIYVNIPRHVKTNGFLYQIL